MDANSATILMESADRHAVDAFESWYAVAAVEYLRQSPGAVHETIERWLGHEVPSHTLRLGSPDRPSPGSTPRSGNRRGRARLRLADVFEVEGGQVKSGIEHVFDLYSWDEFWS